MFDASTECEVDVDSLYKTYSSVNVLFKGEYKVMTQLDGFRAFN